MGMALLSTACPRGWASDDSAAGTGMSGTPQEYSALEKTLKQERIDALQARISDLGQENKFLAERVKMLERSVNDLKDRVDRRF